MRCGIALHASGEPLDYGARLSAPARPPGWFKHPTGTVAYEFAGSMPEPARFASEGSGSMPPKAASRRKWKSRSENRPAMPDIGRRSFANHPEERNEK